MNIDGKNYRTIWLSKDQKSVQIIDQRKLPFEFNVENVDTVDQMCTVIKEMYVRGAGLIGAAAAYGMYLAVLESNDDKYLHESAKKLKATRPTAVNLAVGVEYVLDSIKGSNKFDMKSLAMNAAEDFANQDSEKCRSIGLHGFSIIQALASKKQNGEPVNILTHCNAGWLAFVDYGSALSPIYEAHNRGLNIHVYVDETRPRNQGARLTAWELAEHGVPHTVIADNLGGHLMQHGMVDMIIVGADRVAANGDVANKIGTYLKALAAKDNDVPFYVAFPSTTHDLSITDGVKQIEIEERGGEEVTHMEGLVEGNVVEVQIIGSDSKAANYGFDVTPARLITAWITENGIIDLK